MSRPGQQAAPEKSAQDLADDHELRIIRAKQRCRPVTYQGKHRFISAFYGSQAKTEMEVYLTGSPEIVRPCEITFGEIPT